MPCNFTVEMIQNIILRLRCHFNSSLKLTWYGNDVIILPNLACFRGLQTFYWSVSNKSIFYLEDYQNAVHKHQKRQFLHPRSICWRYTIGRKHILCTNCYECVTERASSRNSYFLVGYLRKCQGMRRRANYLSYFSTLLRVLSAMTIVMVAKVLKIREKSACTQRFCGKSSYVLKCVSLNSIHVEYFVCLHKVWDYTLANFVFSNFTVRKSCYEFENSE